MTRLFSVILLICGGLTQTLSAEEAHQLFAPAIDKLVDADHIPYSDKLIDVNGDELDDLLYCYYLPYESRADFNGISCLVIFSGTDESTVTELDLPLSEDIPCIKWNGQELEVHSFYRHVTTILTFAFTHASPPSDYWRPSNESAIDEETASEQQLATLFSCD